MWSLCQTDLLILPAVRPMGLAFFKVQIVLTTTGCPGGQICHGVSQGIGVAEINCPSAGAWTVPSLHAFSRFLIASRWLQNAALNSTGWLGVATIFGHETWNWGLAPPHPSPIFLRWDRGMGQNSTTRMWTAG